MNRSKSTLIDTAHNININSSSVLWGLSKEPHVSYQIGGLPLSLPG